MTTNLLNVALFGLGRAGQFHINSIMMLPRIRLYYVVDVDEARVEQFKTLHDCKGSTDPQVALSDPTVNCVIVATPTPTHFEFIRMALQAGKAVLTEKPLGTTLQQIDDCYHLAEEKKLPLFVAFNRRFDPSFHALAESVKNGEIGQLQILKTTSRDSPLPSLEYLKISCGIFHDCIVHDLDMIRFISNDEPVSIYSVGNTFNEDIKKLNDLDTVMVTLKLRSGAVCTIDVSRDAAYGYDQRVEAFGDKGMIQVLELYMVHIHLTFPG